MANDHQANDSSELKVLRVDIKPVETSCDELQATLDLVSTHVVNVQVVATIEAAIKHIADNYYDIILLNPLTADQKSLQALDELIVHTPGVSVIPIIEQENKSLADKALKHGAKDYLFKTDLTPDMLERVFRYVLGQRDSEQQISKLVHYDTLTGVANRFLFNDRLSQAEIRAERSGRHISVLFLDLDHFHGVNETLGYEMGDQLLKQAAMRVVSCVRRQDTIARLGGDEFAVVLEDISDPQDLITVSKQILEAFQEPIYLNEQPIFISVSIGMSVSDDHTRDGQTLIKQADIARYRAKEYGRNNFQFFQVTLNEAAQRQLDVEQEVKVALDRIFKKKNGH